MKLYDIDKLIRDVNQDGLYNLFEPTFTLTGGYPLNVVVAEKDEFMRIDLICSRIYNSINDCDFLLSLNDIDNPLNIMEGDEIYYTSNAIIPQYRAEVEDISETKTPRFLNTNKSSKKDSNRKKYIEEDYALPPTYNKNPQPAVKIEGNQIIIG